MLLEELLVLTEDVVCQSELISFPLLLLLLSPQVLQLLQKSWITSWCTSRGLRYSWSKGASWRGRERREGGCRERMLVGTGPAHTIYPGTGAGMMEKFASLTMGNITMGQVMGGRPRNVAMTYRTKSHFLQISRC